MREIKFRAWHKPTQLMDDVVLIDIYNEKIGILYADPVMQCESIQKYNFNEVELMQYTGLKDKNGKEIYEGDVVSNGEFVRYLTGQERCFDVGVVRYDTKSGCLVINNNNGRTKRLTVKVIKNNRVKVLGNIYENPELMV